MNAPSCFGRLRGIDTLLGVVTLPSLWMGVSFNHIAIRTALIVWSFDHSECHGVKEKSLLPKELTLLC